MGRTLLWDLHPVMCLYTIKAAKMLTYILYILTVNIQKYCTALYLLIPIHELCGTGVVILLTL